MALHELTCPTCGTYEVLTTVRHDPKDLERCPECGATVPREMGTLTDPLYTKVGNEGLNEKLDPIMAMRNKRAIEKEMKTNPNMEIHWGKETPSQFQPDSGKTLY